MQKTERLVAITLLLQARGKMTAKRLSEILGISVRTVYRDIVALSLAHVPVSMDYGPGGGYYLPADYHFESAIFTREEAISLLLSADIEGHYNLFAGDADLHRALIKLEAVLPEEYRIDVRAAREHILVDNSAWCNRTNSPSYLETIRAAVLNAVQLDILYPSTLCQHPAESGLCWLRIEPYGLVFKGLNRRHIRTGRWYLVGFCVQCQSFHPFRVSEIEQLHLRQEPVIPRPNFNLRAYWRETRKMLEKQTPPTVLTLCVSPSARYGLTGDFSIVSEQNDGSVIVKVQVESIDDAIAYVLSLGADATILDPPQVRKAVAAAAHAIAAIYC